MGEADRPYVLSTLDHLGGIQDLRVHLAIHLRSKRIQMADFSPPKGKDMGKKRKGRHGFRHWQKVNRLARWADRGTAWWKEATEGWDRLCTGMIKATVSLFVLSALLAPSHTASMIKVLSPSIQILMNG